MHPLAMWQEALDRAQGQQEESVNSTEPDTCGFCGKDLLPSGPSLYFCCDTHQYRWLDDMIGRQAREVTNHDVPPPAAADRWSLGSVSIIERAIYLANTDDMAELHQAMREYGGRSVLFPAGRPSMHEACPELEKWLDDNDAWEKPLVQEETY